MWSVSLWLAGCPVRPREATLGTSPDLRLVDRPCQTPNIHDAQPFHSRPMYRLNKRISLLCKLPPQPRAEQTHSAKQYPPIRSLTPLPSPPSQSLPSSDTLLGPNFSFSHQSSLGLSMRIRQMLPKACFSLAPCRLHETCRP